MKVNLGSTAIAATAIVAMTAGGYALFVDPGDAITALQSSTPQEISASGLEDGKSVFPAEPATAQDNGKDLELTELARQVVELREQSDSMKQPASGRVDQLSLEIDKLWTEYGYLASELGADPNSEVTPFDVAEQNLNEEEQEEKAIEAVEAELAVYDDVGIQEGSDESWAPDAEAQLYESFQGLSEQGIDAGEVTCHSTFCKADLAITAEYANDALRYLQDVTPWEGESIVWIRDVEQGDGVMYVAREGSSLPPIE